VKYSEETLGELAVFHAAAEAHAKVRSRCDSPMHHLDVQGMSDMLEVALLLKEVGLVNPSGRSAINIVPLFRDHRGFAGFQRHHGPHAVAARLPQAGRQPAARCRK